MYRAITFYAEKYHELHTIISGGARNFIESGRKIYGKFTCDIIYINSHKSK